MRVLSMKFCPHVTQNTLTIIANEANPFILRELYPDEWVRKTEGFRGIIRPGAPGLPPPVVSFGKRPSSPFFDYVTLCLNLKRVNLSGCKKLNASFEIILKKNKINLESGEDIFRFNLYPKAETELADIMKSVMKIRGTLRMKKVCRYLIKKLVGEKAIEDAPKDQPADSVLEIRDNLYAVLNQKNFPSQLVERQTHPEVEF